MNSPDLKIGIFIPCYNVQGCIARVLESLTAISLSRIDEVLVIENKSLDQTLNEVRKVKASGLAPVSKKLKIFANQQNYGLGGSQKIAYDYFRKNGFSHFLILHADAQGDANLIVHRFLEAFDHNPAVDVVFASRFRKDANVDRYNWQRRAGNIGFNWLTWLFTGHFMTDAGTGIIFYRTGVLDQIDYAGLINGCQFNPELNILLHDLKSIKTAEVPLDWEDSTEASSITLFNYAYVLLKLLARYRFMKTVKGYSGWRLFHSQAAYISARYETL